MLMLTRQPGSLDALRRVIERGDCEDELLFQRLLGAGVVLGETRRKIRLRSKLYEDYFTKRL